MPPSRNGSSAATTPDPPAEERAPLHWRHAFSLPNLLTLSRLPLAALVWVYPGNQTWFLWIVGIGAGSDLIDGRVARLLRRRYPDRHTGADEAMGAWLDPVCDKILAISAMGALCYGFGASLAMMLLVVAREILIAPLILLYHLLPVVRETLRFDFHADWLGKLTTTLQFAAAAVILFVPFLSWPLAGLTAVIGSAAAVHYVRRGILRARSAQSRRYY